jgi:hypothetical protein
MLINLAAYQLKCFTNFCEKVDWKNGHTRTVDPSIPNSRLDEIENEYQIFSVLLVLLIKSS